MDWIYVTQDREVMSVCEEDNEILGSMIGRGLMTMCMNIIS